MDESPSSIGAVQLVSIGMPVIALRFVGGCGIVGTVYDTTKVVPDKVWYWFVASMSFCKFVIWVPVNVTASMVPLEIIWLCNGVISKVPDPVVVMVGSISK